jgi:hypothetical protein
MWVIGGFPESNDVWYSSDGAKWTSATLSAPWAPRYNHGSVVFNGKMWVLGGEALPSPRFRDVWYSPDGTSWTQAAASVGWVTAYNHVALVYGGKIWMIGSDVWYSSDGAHWFCVLSPAPWTTPYSGREGLRAVVCDGKMWVLGGGDVTFGARNDVWCSTDGKAWTLVTGSAAWRGREGHSVVVHDGKMWVVGGYVRGWKGLPGVYLNDVWYSAMPTAVYHWWLYP